MGAKQSPQQNRSLMLQSTTSSKPGPGGGAAALENIANKVTPPSHRTARYALRDMLWTHSDLPRLRHCGRSRTGDFVGVRCAGETSGFSGLQSCGSVWACPVCSAKIAARRSLELGCGMLSWENSGGRLFMGTLTMRHHKGHRLAQEWDALGRAWKNVIKTRVWKKWLDRLGSPGLVRVVEVTYGDRNGWHVHLHFVLLVAGDQTGLLQDFRSWLVGKWARAIEAEGFPGALEVGQDVRLVEGVDAAADLGQYLAKSTAYGAAEQLGRELMGSWTKGARGDWSTVPAWRIAEAFQATGEVDYLDLWHEYEKGSKGRRQCTWSRGLRDQLVLDPEKTDEEVAAEEIGTEDLIRLDRFAWKAVLALPWPTSHLLDVVEKKGLEGLKAFLSANGILYTEVGS